ncbi:hypothetical protein CMI41_03195 [Candidatus Pacearchaeota archaeon]|nr:hypothetical protein [Candidatus Pacearchaeota archaeon]|tara:strand:+ start:38287 stop:38949 length:663 start_codon:yes stop_codon:yes gene_type:complete
MQQEVNKYLTKVYLWMGIGLLLSALFAFFVYISPQLQQFIFGNMITFWILIIFELGLVVMISGIIKSVSSKTATGLFFLYSALNGLTLSAILFIYQIQSIFFVFIIAAAMFFAMAVYGATTKRDLSGWGKILFGVLIGLIIALLINMFLRSAAFDFWLAIIGVILFAGLTAYDNQKLIKIFKSIKDKEKIARWTIIGALSLYLDFINLFLSLLRLIGERR